MNYSRGGMLMNDTGLPEGSAVIGARLPLAAEGG